MDPVHEKSRGISLGQEDTLEKGMATHPSILAWRIPWTRGAWRATVHRVASSLTRLKPLSTNIDRGLPLCQALSLHGLVLNAVSNEVG